MAQRVARRSIGAGAVEPGRNDLAATVLSWVFCGMTLAAVGVSIAAVYGAIGEAGLAAAVGLVGIVQLSILIGNRRGPEAAVAVHESHVSDVSDRAATAVREDRREEPDMANVNGPRARTDDSRGKSVIETGRGASRAAGPTGVDFLDDGQLDLHLEPVVDLAETRTVYYRSDLALTRQDGSRMEPYLLSLRAEHGGFAPKLDLALFRRVCPVIRHLKARSRRPGVFCPLSPQSFGERHVLDELIGFLQANKDAAGGMVIEISQPSLAALSPAGMEGLARLAELGATLSLSEARLEGPDPATLAMLGFRFLEIDVAALASAHGWAAFGEEGEVRHLANRAEQAGLTVIAANVMRAEELDHVRPLARLARGSLFAPPRIVRRDITELPRQAVAA